MRRRNHGRVRAVAALTGAVLVVAVSASATSAKTDGVTAVSKQAATTITLAH
jgi:hypothetical protein